MTLDEAQQSVLDDPEMATQLRAVMYGADNRPAWIGAHLPVAGHAALNGYANWAATHYQFYLAFVRDFMPQTGAILDIGCGAGQNTAMLARYGTRVVGVDPDGAAIQFALRHNTGSGAWFVLGRFPKAIDSTSRFDYIFAVETMEHVPHDKQLELLDAALAHLTPAGAMFITTPNETTSSAPHIGIWDAVQMAKVTAHLGDRVVRAGYFDNQRPGVGFVVERASHRALVLRA